MIITYKLYQKNKQKTSKLHYKSNFPRSLVARDGVPVVSHQNYWPLFQRDFNGRLFLESAKCMRGMCTEASANRSWPFWHRWYCADPWPWGLVQILLKLSHLSLISFTKTCTWGINGSCPLLWTFWGGKCIFKYKQAHFSIKSWQYPVNFVEWLQLHNMFKVQNMFDQNTCKRKWSFGGQNVQAE